MYMYVCMYVCTYVYVCMYILLRPASQKLHPDQARKTMYFPHECARRRTNHIKDLNGSCSKGRPHTRKTCNILCMYLQILLSTAAHVGAECPAFTSADQGLQHFIYGSTQMLATQVSRVDKSCVIEELRSQGSFQRFLRHNTVAIDAFKHVEVVPSVR